MPGFLVRPAPTIDEVLNPSDATKPGYHAVLLFAGNDAMRIYIYSDAIYKYDTAYNAHSLTCIADCGRRMVGRSTRSRCLLVLTILSLRDHSLPNST